MSLAGLLTRIVAILDDSRIPYMLTGSLASAYYAAPRATQDVDLVVDMAQDQARPLVHALEADFYVEEALAASGPVVELGVGTGRIAVPTALAGVDVIGVDSSAAMLEVCAERAAASSRT